MAKCKALTGSASYAPADHHK